MACLCFLTMFVVWIMCPSCAAHDWDVISYVFPLRRCLCCSSFKCNSSRSCYSSHTKTLQFPRCGDSYNSLSLAVKRPYGRRMEDAGDFREKTRIRQRKKESDKWKNLEAKRTPEGQQQLSVSAATTTIGLLFNVCVTPFFNCFRVSTCMKLSLR